MKSLILTPHLQQATIEDRKTNSRNTQGLDSINETPNAFTFKHQVLDAKGLTRFAFENIEDNNFNLVVCPKYQPGEIIYLREWFRVHSDLDKVPPRNIKACPIEYKLGGTINCIGDHIQSPGRWRWHQTMPAHLARTFLKVTDVRVERLNSISKEDAISEGIESTHNPIDLTKYKDYFCKKSYYRNPVYSFLSLWQSIYGVDSLEENPWVFAYTFERCDKEGNALNKNLCASAPLC